MRVAFDIDGVLDAFPSQMHYLMTALKAAGSYVCIITGASHDKVTPQDVQAKQHLLTSLGFGKESYDDLVVLPMPHPQNKAKYIKDNKISLLIDNSKDNAKKACKYVPVLILWNSREK
jgi:hypothetical protein